MSLPALIQLAKHINRVASKNYTRFGCPETWKHRRRIRKIVTRVHESHSDKNVTLTQIGTGADCIAYVASIGNQPIPDFVLKIYHDEVDDVYIPTRRDPLARKYFVFPVWKGKYVVIQPRVQTKKRATALERIRKSPEWNNGDWDDDHGKNVGWRDGQPCIIDWNHF